MGITANVIKGDNTIIEDTMQAIALGGQLGQMAADRAWNSVNVAAKATGQPLSVFLTTDNGRRLAQKALGGVFGSIVVGRDPETNAPQTLAPRTDAFINALAAPATWSPDVQKQFAQTAFSSGRVTFDDANNIYKPSPKRLNEIGQPVPLSPSEAYYAQQAADMLNRFQPQAPKAAPSIDVTKPQKPFSMQTVSDVTSVPGVPAQPVTKAPQPSNKVEDQPNVLEWAAKTMIKPSANGIGGATFNVLDGKGNVIRANVPLTAAQNILKTMVEIPAGVPMTGPDAKMAAELQAQVIAEADKNLKAAGYKQGQGGFWQAPTTPIPEKYANMGNFTDAQLLGVSQSMSLPADQRKLALDILADRKRLGTGTLPQTRQAGQAQPAQPQPVQPSQPGPVAQAAGQGGTFRQWLIAHPEISGSMQFTRDPNQPDTPDLINGAPMAYRRYQQEGGQGETTETTRSYSAVNVSDPRNMSPQQYREAIMQASATTSELRRLVPGYGRAIDNPMVQGLFLPKEGQTYRAGEVAMAAAAKQPLAAQAQAEADMFKARVDAMKEQSANLRAILERSASFMQPFENEIAKVVPMMQTDPKKAKEMLQRIEDTINSDPRLKGYYDAISTSIAALSGGYLNSLPSLFSVKDKRLLATYLASSEASTLAPAGQEQGSQAARASVPGADTSKADAYEASARR